MKKYIFILTVILISSVSFSQKSDYEIYRENLESKKDTTIIKKTYQETDDVYYNPKKEQVSENKNIIVNNYYIDKYDWCYTKRTIFYYPYYYWYPYEYWYNPTISVISYHNVSFYQPYYNVYYHYSYYHPYNNYQPCHINNASQTRHSNNASTYTNTRRPYYNSYRQAGYNYRQTTSNRNTQYRSQTTQKNSNTQSTRPNTNTRTYSQSARPNTQTRSSYTTSGRGSSGSQTARTHSGTHSSSGSVGTRRR
jgi:hypothetical protein